MKALFFFFWLCMILGSIIGFIGLCERYNPTNSTSQSTVVIADQEYVCTAVHRPSVKKEKEIEGGR